MEDYTNEEAQFITAATAAGILGVSVSTLKKFIIKGKLKAVKTPGGHYRILKKDLFVKLYQKLPPNDLPGKRLEI